ncbi:MAG: Rne/Rng family ribonuclease [Gemmataceae bacterium]
MKKEMLINVLQPEECRIAIVEDGVLEELYVERTSHESYVGNIYKGKIVNIEPSIQAAFVDFGVGRNGFLHVSDVEPTYYRHLEKTGRDQRGSGRDRHRRAAAPPPVEDDWEGAEEAPRRGRDEQPPGEGKGEGRESRSERGEGRESRGERSERGEEQGRSRRRGRGRRGGRRGGERGREARPAHDEAAPADDLFEAPIIEHDELFGHTPEPTEDFDRIVDEDDDARDSQASTPPDDEPPAPRYMESAERRTEEEDADEPEVNDDDIFFPKPEAEEQAYEPAAHDTGMEQEEEEGYEDAEAPGDAEPDYAADEPFTASELMEETDMSVEAEPHERRRYDDDRGSRRGGRGGRGQDRGRRGNGRRPMGRMALGRPKPLIQDIFRRGQEVLVQVIKDGIGTKGPTLSTYISIAGRYLVLMPGLNRIGVSRKIADEEQRRRLREVLNELQPPRGLGFIIRTAGLDKNKKELQRDLAYLARLWQVVVRRIKKLKAPTEIYQESDMITRTIRDIFTKETDTIWVDEPQAYEHAQEFLQFVMPRYAQRIKLYSGVEPLFHRYGIENEINRIQRRHVPLPMGGSIVIDQTEALVAIDVNSGNFRADNNAEETAYQMNLLAAKEIARQLRLRDLGGVIVNDFIDMREEKHRRGVERAMREAVRRDRARTKILKISAFGIIEMTRQRIRPSLKRSVYQDCPHCMGTGQVKTCESMSIDVMRMLQLAVHRNTIQRINIRVSDGVANYLLNRKRREIARLEESGSLTVHVTSVPGAAPELLEFVCTDNNNNEVKFLPFEDSQTRKR